MNGGLVIDQFGRTTVEGLYAAGETAGGPHGADRLGGNMFPAGQIFGERAGLHAAVFAQDHPSRPEVSCHVPSWGGQAPSAAGLTPDDLPVVYRELQRRASRALLIVREDVPLRQFLAFVDELEARRPVPTTPPEAGLRSLLLAGKAMASAALLREESRGGHYRKDFPETHEAWNRRIVLRLDSSGGVSVRLT
jgi:L-aspartate oxidase